MKRLLAASLSCLIITASHAAPQATPGQWEITTKMSMTGMKMEMPATTVKFCMKPEDAKNIERQTVPRQPNGKAPDCKMLENTVSGNTVKFRMQCSGQHPSEIAGEMTYGTNSYKGRTVIDTSGPQGKMQMTSEYSAKRLGDC